MIYGFCARAHHHKTSINHLVQEPGPVRNTTQVGPCLVFLGGSYWIMVLSIPNTHKGRVVSAFLEQNHFWIYQRCPLSWTLFVVFREKL